MLKESADGKYFKYGDKSIPRDFLEKFLELNISTYELSNVLDYYRIQRDYILEQLTVEEAEGVDLRGKTVRMWLSNWEDSEWIYGDGLETIKKGEYGYEFVPTPELQRYADSETDEEFDEAAKALSEAGYVHRDMILSLNLDVISDLEILTPREKTAYAKASKNLQRG